MTLLIFDCDGVLVDSEVIAHQTLLDALAPLGFTMSLQEAYAVFAGRSLRDTLGVIERQIGRTLPADFLPRSRDLLFERFRAALQPVAGVEDAIAALPVAAASPVVGAGPPSRARRHGLRRRSASTCSAPRRSRTASPRPTCSCWRRAP